ncbi:tetraspanin-1-like [Colossoma macropomum]|uniref:tetraspanin-1-like n=1 Tax=Colossoma macropomum TaxID=42526 RepID=UPI001865448B|nr:tetraspanin-1-like [Colossoma macropomum]
MCCAGFLKIMMFIFNGLIFLAGGVILGVGIWVTVDKSSLLGVLEGIKDAPPELAQLANVGYLLIAVGAVLAVMGFLGCCGAITENKCMLLTFFIIVLIIFIAEVAGAIVVLVFKPLANEALQKLNQEVVDLIKKDYGKDDAFTTVMNETMRQLTCCGYNNYTDFTGSPFETATSRYPESCCRSNGTCIERNAEAQGVPGCFNSLVQLLEDNAAVLGGVAIGIAALEIAAMVVSMVLYKNVGK